MTKQELFAKKGQLTFDIQIMQAELQAVDQQLVKLINEERNAKQI